MPDRLDSLRPRQIFLFEIPDIEEPAFSVSGQVLGTDDHVARAEGRCFGNGTHPVCLVENGQFFLPKVDALNGQAVRRSEFVYALSGVIRHLCAYGSALRLMAAAVSFSRWRASAPKASK